MYLSSSFGRTKDTYYTLPLIWAIDWQRGFDFLFEGERKVRVGKLGDCEPNVSFGGCCDYSRKTYISC